MKRGLKEYARKRAFNKTPEPKAKSKRSGKILRFVVQRHAARRLHYDFRLEVEGVLASWAVPKGPSLNPKVKRLAIQVEDHPYEYRTFEGVIPKGQYGAGTVQIWDEGTYTPLNSKHEPIDDAEARREIAKGHLSFVLHGKKLQGEFTLVRMHQGDNQWLLIKRTDTHATTEETQEKESRSRRSRSALPKQVRPMLAKLTDKPFNNSDWIFEVKWDGYRALAIVEKGQVTLQSRNFKSFNATFKPIVEDLRKIKHDCILDGEVVVLDHKGRSDFQALQNYQKTSEGNLVYCVFDLLFADGKDLRDLPLIERKKYLQKILPSSSRVRFSDHVVGKGVSVFKAAQKMDLEGIMAKDGRSPYRSVRSGEWLKIKSHQRQEVVIAGFTKPRGSREGFGSLIMGVYGKEGLKYCGHVGGGFDTSGLREMLKTLQPLVTAKCPFVHVPKTNMPVTWVKPRLVGEVSFAEWTQEGIMRQPIFIGLRKDKDPEQVVRERKVASPEAAVEGPSHPDKVLWPDEGYTKQDLYDYYAKIAPYLLPYLKDRPESLHRHPNGIDEPGFFHKNLVDVSLPKGTKTFPVNHEGKVIHYLIINSKVALLFAANLGCIEINPFSAKTGNLDNPTYMVIDLDPEDISFDKVVEVAQVVHEVLDDIGAPNCCKTSGATGLHIYVPMGGKYTFDEVKAFAQLVCIAVHRRLPKITSLERKPSKRQKRVYLDFLQNNRGQTLAAPYSLRPRAGAPVSTPLRWSEVKKGLDPHAFTIKTIFPRLKRTKDLFKPVLGKGISLAKCLSKLESQHLQ